MAVLLGVTVGCSPLFGLHLPMCVVFAKLAGVSAVTTYLVSYVNNPLLAPVTFYLSLGVGRWLFTGEWPTLRVDYAHAAGVWHIGRDVLAGSLIVGLTLGSVLASLVYRFSSRHEERISLPRRLAEAAARRYLETGIVNWEFVRGKLRHDPLYLALLRTETLPRDGRLLDLGCGRGVALAMLEAARKLHASDQWHPDYPPPPRLELSGVDAHAENITIARSALSADVALRAGDLTEFLPPPCEAVLLLDVLHYLRPHQQQSLIARVAAALQPRGVLLIREPDAGAGMGFIITRMAERVCALVGGRWRQKFDYRSTAAWAALLKAHGFAVNTAPMSSGTPFANVLIVACRA